MAFSQIVTITPNIPQTVAAVQAAITSLQTGVPVRAFLSRPLTFANQVILTATDTPLGPDLQNVTVVGIPRDDVTTFADNLDTVVTAVFDTPGLAVWDWIETRFGYYICIAMKRPASSSDAFNFILNPAGAAHLGGLILLAGNATANNSFTVNPYDNFTPGLAYHEFFISVTVAHSGLPAPGEDFVLGMDVSSDGFSTVRRFSCMGSRLSTSLAHGVVSWFAVFPTLPNASPLAFGVSIDAVPSLIDSTFTFTILDTFAGLAVT